MFDVESSLLREWAGMLVAFVAMLILTPLVIKLAHWRKWLAYPKADRWHQKPTALMGGIAIYGAATLGVLAFGFETLPWPVWAGASLMFATGLADDLKNLRPVAKLVPQIVATGLLIFSGYSFGHDWSPWIAVPLTFLWVVGITNALNLLDNMDGLAAGTAAIAAVALALYASITGMIGTVVAATAVAGAAFGFLVFNFKPARIFMGDCGSLFLGYMVASLAVIIQSEPPGTRSLAVYFVSAAVLAVPIFDTTLVTVMRTLSGRAVSQGGRDHSSHRLVFLGLSERQAVLTLYGISSFFGATALVLHFAEVRLFYAVLALMAVALVLFGSYLGSADVYGYRRRLEPPAYWGDTVVMVWHALFGGRAWKNTFAVVADLLLVTSAYVLAYYLRFENGLSAWHQEYFDYILPVVAAVKIPVFFFGGLYHSIWRYAGTPEIIRIAYVTIAASILSFLALGLLFGFEHLSRGAAFIDWMITALAVTGVRLGFRGLRQYFSSKRHQGRRVLLYGAGDAGLLSLRELRQNPELGLIPVGFLDDDPSKLGLAVQGLAVQGALENLETVARRLRVEEVLISAFRISGEQRDRICNECQRLHIPCRVFHISFSEILLSSDGAESDPPYPAEPAPIPRVLSELGHVA